MGRTELVLWALEVAALVIVHEIAGPRAMLIAGIAMAATGIRARLTLPAPPPPSNSTLLTRPPGTSHVTQHDAEASA